MIPTTRPFATLVFLLCPLSLTAVGCSKDAPRPTASNEASATSSTSKPKPLPDRDPQLAKQLVANGALLLDVRSQQEWDEKHLEGATLIPVDELDARMNEVSTATGGDRDKPIVVYCRSGARAGRAKQALLKAGYTQVTNLGGIDDWPAE